MTNDYRLRLAIARHLTENFESPLPTKLVIDGCIEAINACNEGDPTRLIILEEQSYIYDEVTAIAGEIIENLRLGRFVGY